MPDEKISGKRELSPPGALARAARLLGGRALTTLLVLQMAACGYFLYPERRGQTKGQVDPAIAIMDGLLVLVFVIPGLIAFAIDMTSGTIYLPAGGEAALDCDDTERVAVIQLPPDQLTRERIENALSEHLGKPVDLAAEGVEVYEAESPRDACAEMLRSNRASHRENG